MCKRTSSDLNAAMKWRLYDGCTQNCFYLVEIIFFADVNLYLFLCCTKLLACSNTTTWFVDNSKTTKGRSTVNSTQNLVLFWLEFVKICWLSTYVDGLKHKLLLYWLFLNNIAESSYDTFHCGTKNCIFVAFGLTLSVHGNWLWAKDPCYSLVVRTGDATSHQTIIFVAHH